MKTRIIALVAPFLFLLASCEDSKVSTTDVSNTLKSGTWEITFYWNNNQDETAEFAAYDFIFASNNVVTANNGTNSEQGTWYVAESGDEGDESDLVLYFGSSFVFSELNDNWHVMEKSASRIHMQHINPGGGTDLLTFEKL